MCHDRLEGVLRIRLETHQTRPVAGTRTTLGADDLGLAGVVDVDMTAADVKPAAIAPGFDPGPGHGRRL